MYTIKFYITTKAVYIHLLVHFYFSFETLFYQNVVRSVVVITMHAPKQWILSSTISTTGITFETQMRLH